MRSSERRRRLAALRLAVVILLVGAVASGCLFRQRREMIEAREAYRKCVRENPDSHEQKCEELKAEAVTRQQRYGDDAQRAWGCGASGGDCDPRDRAPRVP